MRLHLRQLASWPFTKTLLLRSLRFTRWAYQEWPVPGYTSPHGTTHLQDATTQLVLAVCHLTKHNDDSGVNNPPLPPAPPPPLPPS